MGRDANEEEKGREVEFDTVPGPAGLEAVRVRRPKS